MVETSITLYLLLDTTTTTTIAIATGTHTAKKCLWMEGQATQKEHLLVGLDFRWILLHGFDLSMLFC